MSKVATNRLNFASFVDMSIKSSRTVRCHNTALLSKNLRSSTQMQPSVQPTGLQRDIVCWRMEYWEACVGNPTVSPSYFRSGVELWTCLAVQRRLQCITQKLFFFPIFSSVLSERMFNRTFCLVYGTGKLSYSQATEYVNGITLMRGNAQANQHALDRFQARSIHI